MFIFTAILFSALAGIVNGSYAFPVKRMHKWSLPVIWLAFSVITFFIIPWLVLIVITPHLWNVLAQLSPKLFGILSTSGFIFGIGMVLFTYSLRYVGMGIAFILNISVGTVFGSLVPSFILDRAHLWGGFEIFHYVALLLFLVGISLAGWAVYHRDFLDKHGATYTAQKRIVIGLAVGVLSGLFTSMQGIAYAYAFPIMDRLHKIDHLSLFDVDNIPWVIIFSAAFIPYALYFFKLAYKNNSLREYTQKEGRSYWLWIILMGCLYFSSLFFYTQSTELLGYLGPAIAWPIMMSFIIFTANLWSYVQKEWQGRPAKCHWLMGLSILVIVLAVTLLGWDYYAHTIF